MNTTRSSVESETFAALMCCDPLEKCNRVQALVEAWHAGHIVRLPASIKLGRVDVPGRPAKPMLIAPEHVPRRKSGTTEGRAALIHAVAHIEFNAINLALDCAVRFSTEGDAFVTDWLRVASEEAKHFQLLVQRLSELGYAYGDFSAHNGLWEMAVKTDHDLLARMALVPRLLEARGLDATPPIQARLKQVGDDKSLEILDIILRDEIGHVAIGDRWFRAACTTRGLEPESAFRDLLTAFDISLPRPPFNRSAREAAGFSADELDEFERNFDQSKKLRSEKPE